MTEETTGGQYCVTGLVQQVLVGLERGVTVVIDQTEHEGPMLVAATMTLEPQAGGDHDLVLPAQRIVEQVKIRTNGKAWTPGEIADDVLPDLVKAVRADNGIPTRFRLVTDGALNCETLLAFAAQLNAMPVPEDPILALDDRNTRAFKYGRWLSERGYFQALMRRAGVDDAERFWRLLAGFEAEGLVHAADLEARIDAVLAEVVDAQEDVVGKRHELVGRMAKLAASGGSISAIALLGEAGLPADRLLHAARLPLMLGETLARDLDGLGYVAANDVREPPRVAGSDMLLISGESGFGKSWRLAALLARTSAAGGLAVLVAQARTLDQIRQAVVERVWLSSFDRAIDLPGLQRRLGARFADPTGAWLTVGVDDVQDRDLLAELHAADWQRFGVRVVATVPSQLADEMARRPRPPAEQRVELFTRAQLRRFLASHSLPAHDLPEDVAELLCTPIFADLYRRSFLPGWRPTNEYELMDGFWRQATFDTGGMADAQDDVVALEHAARQLLLPSGHYPWDAESALAAGLNAPARARLVRTGVLRAGTGGYSVMHDRVLNWLVARALVADLRFGRRSVEDAGALLLGFDKAGTIAPAIAYRLGYVLLDLLWLGADCLDPGPLQALVERMLDEPEYRINEGPFIEEHLAGLGERFLPVLALMAAQPDQDHSPRAIHAARAIATIGQHSPDAVRPIVAGLLGESGHSLTMGLAAAGRVAVPHSIDRLWEVHLERRYALAAAPDDMDIHERHVLSDAARSSFKALRRTAIEEIDWIDAALSKDSSALSAELLLELLLEADHGGARDLWRARKAIFLSRIAAGRTIIARAIGRFGDSDEAGRLEQDSAGADDFEPTRRYDALLRVAPERAVAQIDQVPEDMLKRAWFSMPRLVRSGGTDAQARLLARHGTGWEAMRDVVLSYWHDIDLIDVPAFEAVIDALADRLAELAGTDWTPRGEGHLINFLSQTRRPDLLAILRERQGSRFERLVCDLAIGRGGRPCLSVDRDGEQLERLLLLIGGDGYGELVAHGIARETVFGREDGYEAALRLPEGSDHARGLTAAATADERHNRENYDLMLALAAQRLDAPLYDLVAATGAPYTDGLDIRASLGPLDPHVEARIRADLQSSESNVRIGASCALALSPPADAVDLLADTLARCPDDDPSALTVVRIANHLRCYTPRMLPQLRRILALSDPHAREAVLPYLASAGDAEARAIVTAQFEGESTPVIDQCALKAAYSISEYETHGGPATDRLRLFIDRSHGIYPLGLIAARLHRAGVMTNEELVELGYTARRMSSETSAYLIERIATFDREEARAIAEHHFARSPSGSAARQLLLLGGDNAVAHLLERYFTERSHRVRWMIARALRRHADRQTLLERLARLARGNSVDLRVAAAELLGWLAVSQSRELLETLAGDPVPEVADAALAAIGCHQSERHARRLIAELPDADHLGRWARLYAILELADPYLLEADPDGLALGEVTDGFGEAFAIGAECAIKARKDKLEKEADRLGRADRD